MDPTEWANAQLNRLERRQDQLNRLAAQVDRTLITLSSGALVLSMTFVRGMPAPIQLLWLLFIAWGFFVASILCVLFAMAFAQAAGLKNMKELSEKFQGIMTRLAGGTSPSDPTSQKPIKVRFAKTIIGLNIAALFTFVTALIPLGIFVGYNVWFQHASPSQ